MTTTKRNAITAIVLAAGQSKRMGAFKPLLPFGKTTVIRSCINYLLAGGVNEIVVVTGYKAAEIKKSLEDVAGLRFAFNPQPASEMSESIRCGLAEVSETEGAVLVMPADHPAIPPDVVAALIDSWQAGHKLIIPQFNQRGGHPVLIDLAFKDELLRTDSFGGLRGFFSAHQSDVFRLDVNSSYIARDLDTWDDYRALYQDVFGQPPPVLDH